MITGRFDESRGEPQVIAEDLRLDFNAISADDNLPERIDESQPVWALAEDEPALGCEKRARSGSGQRFRHRRSRFLPLKTNMRMTILRLIGKRLKRMEARMRTRTNRSGSMATDH